MPELRRAARDFKDHERSARVAAGVRLGRRRRRADGGDARDAGAGRGPAGRAAHRDRRPRGVLPRAGGGGGDWPEVVGELYLEYHRGTYTSQARTKRASRRAERALHDAELLAAVPARRRRPGPEERRGRRSCSTTSTTSCPGPRSARCTRGRSATWPRWRRRRARCATGWCARRRVVNTAGVARREVVRGSRRSRRSPAVRDRAVRRAARAVAASRSAARLSRSTTGSSARSSAATARCARSSVGGREAMAAPGNVLELYDDRPTDFEAWDLDPFHLETRADCPPATSRRGRARRSAAGRGGLRAPDRRAQPHAPDRAARRRGAAARVPLRDRLAGGPAGAEGALPGRRARAAGDVRDAVRRRRAPDALLHPRATPPSTRCPAIASPTSPSTASGSRCCRRRPTAGRRSAARCG